MIRFKEYFVSHDLCFKKNKKKKKYNKKRGEGKENVV